MTSQKMIRRKKSKGFFKRIYQFFLFMLIPKARKLNLLIRFRKGKIFPLVFKHCMNLSILYFTLYVFFFFVNFSSLTDLNNTLSKNYEAGGMSFIAYFLSLYPFNVIYIFLFWFFMVLFLSIICLLILTLLGEKRKPFGKLSASILYASSFIFLAFFPLLILNSIFPINDGTTLGGFSFLMAIWISIIGIGVLFSATTFGKMGKYLFNHNVNRAVFAWVFSVSTFAYLIYKTVS